eukprot:jgi/Mesen1/6204/ME000320S05401
MSGEGRRRPGPKPARPQADDGGASAKGSVHTASPHGPQGISDRKAPTGLMPSGLPGGEQPAYGGGPGHQGGIGPRMSERAPGGHPHRGGKGSRGEAGGAVEHAAGPAHGGGLPAKPARGAYASGVGDHARSRRPERGGAVPEEVRIQQAKKAAMQRCHALGATGHFRTFDSPYGNYLLPVIPLQFLSKTAAASSAAAAAGASAAAAAGLLLGSSSSLPSTGSLALACLSSSALSAGQAGSSPAAAHVWCRAFATELFHLLCLRRRVC